MNVQDCEQLTLFPEDSHASRSPLPGSEWARMMTVTSGRKCCVSSKNSGPLGSSVKTLLGSSIWHSTRCYLTWKTQDTTHRRLLYRLAASMPRTDATGYVFWPTPMASSWGGTGHRKTLKALRDKGMITEEERLALQQGNQIHTNPGLLEWLMGYEQQFTKLIPTPTATDYKGGCLERYWRSSSQNVHVERERERENKAKRGYDGLLRSFLELTPLGKIGPMNPNWIEWQMGYPIGWTE